MRLSGEMNWARDISRLSMLRSMLALVLMLQASLSATAMARMDAARFAPDGGAIEVVICTADGIRTVQLPSGTSQHEGHQDCECPCATLCAAFHAAQLAPDISGTASGPDWHAGSLPAPVRAVRITGPDASGRPGSPRSPPRAV